MVLLNCIVVEEGGVISIIIEEWKTVALLKKAIKEEMKYTITCDADKLQLFLAKTAGGKWLRDGDPVMLDLEGGRIHPNVQAMIDVGELRPTWTIEEVLSTNKMTMWYGRAPKSKQVHVLVRVPPPTAGRDEIDEVALSTVDPEVQLRMWQSVVKVSSEYVCSGTGLVLDQTATHVYLLTNLHTWIDNDGTFIDHMSEDFKREIKHFLRLNPTMKPSGGKRKSDDVAVGPHKSPRMLKEAQLPSDIPQVVVEQLLPNSTLLTRVHQFSLHSGVCWRSSADFDFAIFEVTVPPNVQLVPRQTSRLVYPTMNVHIFGFPGILEKSKFDHAYAITPTQITGWSGNKMMLSSLSTPGLSGSAIVCTRTGIPVGYLGGGLDGPEKHDQYQSYGYTFHVMPTLPSAFPPDTDVEAKEEL